MPKTWHIKDKTLGFISLECIRYADERFERMKYRRITAVYITDMKTLEWEEHDIWNEMKMGIPWTALGRGGIMQANRRRSELRIESES